LGFNSNKTLSNNVPDLPLYVSLSSGIVSSISYITITASCFTLFAYFFVIFSSSELTAFLSTLVLIFGGGDSPLDSFPEKFSERFLVSFPLFLDTFTAFGLPLVASGGGDLNQNLFLWSTYHFSIYLNL
jgi:ABC-type uncharacterized transport system permease subunit